jgi:hypothetical protein
MYIDWVVFNANLSSISDISWHEKDYRYLLIDPPPPPDTKKHTPISILKYSLPYFLIFYRDTTILI